MHDVHRFVRRRTGDDALADDLTALVFERCWVALPGLRLRHDSLLPWLLRVAANVLASHYRSDERRRRREHLVVARDEVARHRRSMRTGSVTLRCSRRSAS